MTAQTELCSSSIVFPPSTSLLMLCFGLYSCTAAQQFFIPQRPPLFCHPTRSSPKQSLRPPNFLSASFTLTLKHAFSRIIIQVLHYVGSVSPTKLQASKSQDHVVPPALSLRPVDAVDAKCLNKLKKTQGKYSKWSLYPEIIFRK